MSPTAQRSFFAATVLLSLSLTSCENDVEISPPSTFGIWNVSGGTIQVEWNGDRDTRTSLNHEFFTPVGTVRNEGGGPAPGLGQDPLWCLHVIGTGGQTIFQSTEIPTDRYLVDNLADGGKRYMLAIDADFLSQAPVNDNCMGLKMD